MAFDPAAATAAYIDALGPEALAKAADYTRGSEWLLLWGVVVSAIVTVVFVRSAPLALRAMKLNFLAAENVSLREYIRIESERHQRTGASEDSRAAFRAFVEKREPEFKGR